MVTRTLDALRRFIETAPDAMLVVDPAGEVCIANSRASAMFATDDLTGTRVEDLMPARFRDDHVRLREKFAKQPTPRVMGATRELEAQRLDGTVFPVDISLGIVDTPGTQLISVAIRDVTERHESEARAAMNEFIVGSTREAIIAVDTTGRITTWNQAAERLTGCAAERAIGRQLTECFVVLDPDLADRLGRATEGSDIVDHERTVIRRRDDNLISVAVSMVPVRDAHGSRHGATALVRDITEEVETQQILADAQARMEDAQRLADMGLWVWETAGDEVQWSRQMHEIAGIEPSDFGGDRDAHLAVFAAESRDDIRQQMDEAVSEYRGFEMDCSLVRPDGTLRWVHLSGQPDRSRNGSVRGLSGVCQDITERQEAMNALREADRLKDEFLGTVSHELRTPLTSILGFTEHLLPRLPSELRSHGEVILRNTREMHAMVERILDFSRAHSGRFELQICTIDLAEFMHDLEPLVSSSLDAHDYVQQIGAGLTVRSDADALRRILVNLLTNAAKFTPSGRRVELRATSRGDRCRIEVRDEGPGIAAENLDAVFDRFFQVEASLVSSRRGAGVGLSIVKTYVEAMGGRTWAESTPGEGSTFVVELPRGEP